LANDDKTPTPPNQPEGGDGGPASMEDISLEQALLAPLDAILKAQLHSARSFLNMLLQLGYPHDDKMEGKPWELKFKQDVDIDGEIHEQTIRVPALALVPIAPLAVNNAEFQLEMAVRKIGRHSQMRASAGDTDRETRPWFLVDKPINIEGVIAPPDHPKEGESAKRERESSIKIAIKVNSIPMPRGLEKLLTSLTEIGQIQQNPKPSGNTNPSGNSNDNGNGSGSDNGNSARGDNVDGDDTRTPKDENPDNSDNHLE